MWLPCMGMVEPSNIYGACALLPGGAYAHLVRRQVFAGGKDSAHESSSGPDLDPANKSLALIAQERGLHIGPEMSRQVGIDIVPPAAVV